MLSPVGQGFSLARVDLAPDHEADAWPNGHGHPGFPFWPPGCRTSYTEYTDTASARPEVFELSPVEAKRLQKEAGRLGVAPAALAKAALADLLTTPDAEFRSVAERVLRKNRELYRRLA